MHYNTLDNPQAGEKAFLLGAHFSIAKGLHNAFNDALSCGCDVFQIFTKNAITWKERKLSQDEIDRFDRARKGTGITAVASHTSYLINLAADEHDKHALSCKALTNELIRSSILGIPFVVLHPGSHMRRGENNGLEKIVASINAIFKQTPDIQTKLLLETTAGQGSSIGYTFEQLATIMNKVKKRGRLGVCLDTSHIFAAGYDIRTKTSYDKTMGVFDAVIGLEHLHLLHLNDSKKQLASRVDRHEHIGEGYIGIEAFRLLMNDERLAEIPKIIETPKHKADKECDMINLNRLRGLLHPKACGNNSA